MSLFAELKRRNVFKVGAAYLVVGWLVIEVASTLAPQLNLPEWAPRLVTFLILLGFPVALVLAWIFDMTPEGVQVTQGGVGDRMFYGIVVVIAAVAMGWFFVGGDASEVPEPATAPAPAEVTGVPERSIAVLPFVSLSTSEDDRYFGQGLAEELLNALARFPDLQVAARTSAFAFDGQDVDLRQVGEALNVANVLEGSVRRSGDRLRITAQLIRVSDGFHLWSETYERTSADVFDIQDDIVRELTRNLQVRLGVGGGTGRAEGRSVDPRAYETYLRGLYLFGRRENSDGSRREAYAAFQMATSMAPDFADGWAAFAMAGALSGAGLLGIDQAEFDSALIEAMDRALALDPDNARAHAVRAIWYGRRALDFDRAEMHRLRALELAPNSVEAHYATALVKVLQGDFATAFEAFDRAVAIDPLNLTLQRVRAQSLTSSGQYARAREYYRSCGDECSPRELAAATWWLLDSLCSGDAVEVAQRRAATLEALSSPNDAPLPSTVIRLSSLLYPVEPVGDLSVPLFDSTDWALLAALWYARQGEVALALDRLQSGYDSRNLFSTTVSAGPLSCAPMAYPEALLRHPRYHAFWAQPGLAELATIRRANGLTQGLPQ